MIIFAIEASCDETAVAINQDGRLLSSITHSQVQHHAQHESDKASVYPSKR